MPLSLDLSSRFSEKGQERLNAFEATCGGDALCHCLCAGSQGSENPVHSLSQLSQCCCGPEM